MKKEYLIDELSVFFPCYNEENNVTPTTQKAIKILEQITPKWEILLIDDGSKDKTPQVAKKLQQQYPKNIKVVTHNPNRGYGAAFKSGIYNSSYKWIAFTDVDGQFDFSEINHFISTQKDTNADLVIGYYKKRQVSKFVIITSKIWEMIVFILFGLRVHDIDCGFKLFKKEVVDTIPKLESERGAFVNSEFLLHAKHSGFKIIEIPVTHYQRSSGKPTGRNFNVILKSFTDLFRLWYKVNFSHK